MCTGSFQAKCSHVSVLYTGHVKEPGLSCVVGIPTVVHRPPDIAPQNTENESRIDKGASTQGNVSTYFSINTLSISLT